MHRKEEKNMYSSLIFFRIQYPSTLCHSPNSSSGAAQSLQSGRPSLHPSNLLSSQSSSYEIRSRDASKRNANPFCDSLAYKPDRLEITR